MLTEETPSEKVGVDVDHDIDRTWHGSDLCEMLLYVVYSLVTKPSQTTSRVVIVCC